MDLQHLTNIAIKAALDAGKSIKKAMQKDIVIKQKEGGTTYASQVVTQVDYTCERIILKHLKPTCKTFDIALLSEETEDDESRFDKNLFWCIDPLDGTLAFINKHPGFSVSIALVAKDGTPLIGVIYDPSRNNLFYAIQNKGAFKNGLPWKIKHSNKHLTYVTDKSLADTPNSDEIKKIIKHKTFSLGLKNYKEISGAGAVLNAVLVAEHAPAILIKLPKKEKGGGSIWDFAATACVFKELGLSATNFYGKHLDLNKKENSFMNHEGVLYVS